MKNHFLMTIFLNLCNIIHYKHRIEFADKNNFCDLAFTLEHTITLPQKHYLRIFDCNVHARVSSLF